MNNSTPSGTSSPTSPSSDSKSVFKRLLSRTPSQQTKKENCDPGTTCERSSISRTTSRERS